MEVQMHEGRGHNHQAYLWQYGSPGGGVVFDFRLGRGREGPKHFLQQFEGILQTDGYAAYDHVGGTRVVHAACWAHARRKFVEAVRLNPTDAAATCCRDWAIHPCNAQSNSRPWPGQHNKLNSRKNRTMPHIVNPAVALTHTLLQNERRLVMLMPVTDHWPAVHSFRYGSEPHP